MAYKDNSKPYSNQKNWSDTYLTDPDLLKILGPFDTDPCTPANMPWVTATTMYCVDDDGLSKEWAGRVFMNPPYRKVMVWAEKFIQCESGIALLNGRSPETKATQLIMHNSTCIWFPAKRLTFFKGDGTPWPMKWFPSLLIGISNIDKQAFFDARKTYGGEIFSH